MPPKKRRKHRKDHPQDSVDLEEEIEVLFNKKFVLKSSEETWAQLPDSSSMFLEPPFILEDMICLKDELNRKKSLLNDMDIVQWHLHTRRAHKAGLVVKHLRESIHAEMCTQAWTKFFEILHSFDLIPENAQSTGTFRSVHLCEAPGAFIASLNHFLKSRHHGLEWDWVASTLNPYYEGHDLAAMLDDDRFVLQTLPHWHFGADGTGDLMSLTNLESLQQDTADTHLVTADGSINCANQPDEQESLVGQLIFCEAVAAINLLCQGGNFVFKMFTAFEHQMVCLLYLLACLFQEIQVIKPGTSKSGNSEIYVVCLKFIGKEEIPSSVMEKLCQEYGAHCQSFSLYSLRSIPCVFLERLKACEMYFNGLQVEAIDQNIQQFYFMSSAERKAHTRLRQLVVEKFVETFHLQPISTEEHVVPGANLDGTQLSFTRGPTNDVPFSESFNGRHQMGSYNERHKNLNQGWLEKIQADGQFKFHPAQLRKLQDHSQVCSGVPLIPLYSDQVVWLQGLKCATPEITVETWKPQSAAHLNAVLNSRFCTPFYINKLQEAHQQASILRKENIDNLNAILDKVNPANIVKMSRGGEAEVRNLDNLVFFTEMAKGGNCGIVLNLTDGLDCLPYYLQGKSARFNSVHICISTDSGTPVATINQGAVCQLDDISQRVKSISQISNEQGISLVFSDLNHSDELSSKRDLLSLSIIALKLLGAGGMFVCRIFETLTRFSVGLLYIFHQLFDKLTIVKPVMSQVFNSQRFLVCKGFNGDKKHYVAYLEKVLNQLMTLDCNESALDIVEIIPMQLLYSEQFYSFVKKTNEQLAHIQLQNIVQLENYFLSPDKMPSAEDISNLREDILAYLK